MRSRRFREPLGVGMVLRRSPARGIRAHSLDRSNDFAVRINPLPMTERDTIVVRSHDSIETWTPAHWDNVHESLEQRGGSPSGLRVGPREWCDGRAFALLAGLGETGMRKIGNIGNPGMNTVDRASRHRPVLLQPAIEALAPRPDGAYLDATFGGGGHTRALLQRIPSVGVVYAIDADGDAITRARDLARDPGFSDRLVPIHANFGDLRQVAKTYGIRGLDGVLMDLGLSSFQLDEAQRGFAFRFDAPLDMRFDRSAGPSAGELVNTLPESDLASIIWRYGEEPKSRQIAAAVVRSRVQVPIVSTGQLAHIVERAVDGRKGRGTHPATRTFQAIRIAVNSELAVLQAALEAAVDLLSPGGRLVVISFHSLEDRIVKQFIAAATADCVCPPAQPICTCETVPRLRRASRAVKPAQSELNENPRSRSAIMRVAEKLDGSGNAVVRGG